MPTKKLSGKLIGALDIGSNAIRYQVASLLEWNGSLRWKKLEYTRFPLSMGKDVFNGGKIEMVTMSRLQELLQAVAILNRFYQLEAFMAVATSAFRDANNGQEVAEAILLSTGINIRILSGPQEAALLDLSLQKHIGHKDLLHVDVGGGSTELNYYSKGIKAASHSFDIGSVRMRSGAIFPENEIEHWIRQHLPDEGVSQSLCTGGNMAKLRDWYQQMPGKKKQAFNREGLETVKNWLSGFSEEEKMGELDMNPDRAGVIDYAALIYSKVLQFAKVEHIEVPDAGLKDGVLEYLFSQLVRSRTYTSPELATLGLK